MLLTPPSTSQGPSPEPSFLDPPGISPAPKQETLQSHPLSTQKSSCCFSKPRMTLGDKVPQGTQTPPTQGL